MSKGCEGRIFPELRLPAVHLRTMTDEEGTLKVFDPLRQKYVVLTPEEYVRQHFVSWLHEAHNYPIGVIANEVGIMVNGRKRRCDTVVFGRDGNPLVIVEYKQPEVSITQEVFDQIVRYNMALHASYLIVSNGMNHYCCKIDYINDTYHFIPVIPKYDDICHPFSQQ